MRTALSLFLILILVFSVIASPAKSLALTPVADLTGQWSGFGLFDEVWGCQQTVKLNAEIEQDGNQIAGTYSFVSTGFKATKEGIDCAPGWAPTQGTFTGTLDGSKVSVVLSDDGLTYTGWYASGGIKLSVNSDWLTGTIQLSPTNFTPPPFEPTPAPPPPEEEPAPPQEEEEPEPEPQLPTEERDQMDDSAEMDEMLDDFLSEQENSEDWAEEEPAKEDELTEDEMAAMEEAQRILEDHVVGNLPANQGDLTITTRDGDAVTSNELKLGTIIQTGTNSDTNVKIELQGGGSINLQENTKLETVGISAVDDDLSYLFDMVKKQNGEVSGGEDLSFTDDDLSYLFDMVKKQQGDLPDTGGQSGGVDEDLSFLFETIKNQQDSMPDTGGQSGGVDEDLSFLFEAVEKQKKSQSIRETVKSFVESELDISKEDGEELYLYTSAFYSGVLLGLIPAGGIPAALIASGYILMTGGGYFLMTADDSEQENKDVVVTPNAALFRKGTEFSVTVEDGTTKIDVIDGEVVVVPFDPSSPILTLRSGHSLSISDEKLSGTALDAQSLDKWWDEAAAQQASEPIQEEQPVQQTESSGGGCLVATAAFGTELAPQVQMLREVRDNALHGTSSGAAFVSAFNSFYYSFSPTVADWERQSPLFKEIIKTAITPMLATLSILSYADVDSESEILGYGIAIILLNIGMYLLVPAILLGYSANVIRVRFGGLPTLRAGFLNCFCPADKKRQYCRRSRDDT